MTQTSYVNPAMTTNYQPSTSLVPMNANNGWTGQLIFPHATQQNHQVQESNRSYVGWFSELGTGRSTDESCLADRRSASYG
jgi:hypothetical protein